MAQAQTHENSSKVFFTSDTHFGHANIINLCSRPYSGVEEMNNTLIDNWNSVVPKDGIVYHLGDFCWGTINAWEQIVSKLNGEIHLIIGNHDEKNIDILSPRAQNLFVEILPQKQILLEDHSIYLNHYPFLCYGGSYRGHHSVWQLFGHVHSGPDCTGLDVRRLVNLFPFQYDVGVDNNKYRPISYNEVKESIQKQIKDSWN